MNLLYELSLKKSSIKLIIYLINNSKKQEELNKTELTLQPTKHIIGS